MFFFHFHIKFFTSFQKIKMWDLIGKITAFVLVSKFMYSILKGLYGSFLGAMIGMNINLKKTGKWAGKY